jgi:hypothetical protein
MLDVDEPLARYPVRTPPGYRITLALIGVLGLAGLAALVYALRLPRHGSGPTLTLLMLGVLALMPLWYWVSTKAYRIAGGAGEIALHADRVVIATGAGRIVFPAATIEIGAAPQIVRYRALGVIPLGQRRVGTLVALASPAQRFTFSSKVLVDEGWLPGLLEDIALVHAGRAPLGPRVAEPPKRPPADRGDGYDYEAELDRELRNVD